MWIHVVHLLFFPALEIPLLMSHHYGALLSIIHFQGILSHYVRSDKVVETNSGPDGSPFRVLFFFSPVQLPEDLVIDCDG